MNSILQDHPETARTAETQGGAAAQRRPYQKPEVLSEATPLLALLSSQCNGVDTPNEG